MLEAIIAMTVFSLVSAGLFALFAGTTRNFSYTAKTVTLQNDLAGALNVFLDDVSLIGFAGYTTSTYNPSGIATASTYDGVDTRTVIRPATALASVTLNGGTEGNPPDSIQFIADIASGSVAPDGQPDRVTYQVTGGNLIRTIERGDGGGGYGGGTTSDTVAARVTGFRLRLYDKAHGNLAANFQNACYVAATVYTMDPTVKGGMPLARALSGEAALRNFSSLSSCLN